jgi:hypothetical protein
LMARSLLVPKTFAMTELSKTVSFGADFVPSTSVNGKGWWDAVRGRGRGQFDEM